MQKHHVKDLQIEIDADHIHRDSIDIKGQE